MITSALEAKNVDDAEKMLDHIITTQKVVQSTPVLIYRSLRATGRKINFQIDIVTRDPSSQETAFFQLHFPALLCESTRVAERRDEAIITMVGTNAIARTDFSASANLCPPDSDQNSHYSISSVHPGRTCRTQP